ncbi:MAG: flavin reductase family protein [Bacteroidia bacterium]|nr:flavin reductase family protein [Bacteroidia bacterium]
MFTINPKEIKTSLLHSYMLSAIAPRPIAFAATVDKAGNVNLSPFSFFNAFGSNPPLVVFSPARRVHDNTTKHTLENVLEVPEVTINVVNHAMVKQASLASSEYEKGINEFVKAGFTEEPSVLIRPPRVKESPVQMECKVVDVIETGKEGGAANLIVCHILLMHISEEVLNADNKIDQDKIDLVGRMGFDLYCRASGEALFQVPKPQHAPPAIGIDNLPASIRNSTILTGNDLGMLGNVSAMPTQEELKKFREAPLYKEVSFLIEKKAEKEVHSLARKLLRMRNVNEAWLALMSYYG